MPISQTKLNHEKKYLNDVTQVLKQIISEEQKTIDYRKANITDLKKFMWDNLSDYTDEERGMALYEMDFNVDATNDKIRQLNRYMKALNNPYFAKIFFKYDDSGEEEPIYIGMISVQDQHQFYVFDWRTPIASLFYNYELGQAMYNSPMGKITGELLEKMQFKIADGKLIRCFQSDINIDDEYLQEILANATTDKMQNIVSTIQRDQNEIIRNDKDKYLIVQGVAGSGKTSVALHRIAYLLYQDRNLRSNNILIFSPNDVFSDYISNVLPELGEENAMKTTIGDFALAYLKPYKNIEDYSQFLERVYASDYVSQESIQYKLSKQCMDDIDCFISGYEKNINFGDEFTINNVTFSNEALREMFLNRYGKLSFRERFDEMAEHICYESRISRKKNMATIKKYLLKQSNILSNPIDLYNQFLKSQGRDPLSSNSNNHGQKIHYEDLTAMLYLYFKMNGFPSFNHIRQIVIDEAQDYTYFQITLLKKIFKNASFTILGDECQTINPYYQHHTLKQLTEIFPGAKYIELNKTYRSSEEIIDYSNQILNLSNVCAIRKNTSVPVETKPVLEDDVPKKIMEDLKSMTKQGFHKVAVITRDAKHANNIYNLLLPMDDSIQCVSTSTAAVKSPIVVIPSYLSKGLEFDGVIAYNDPKESYKENEKNLYYVVCTRAQHKLHIYNEPTKIFTKNM